jgi:hypothetical protein
MQRSRFYQDALCRGRLIAAKATVPIGNLAICIDWTSAANVQMPARKERPKQTPN